MIFQVYQTTKSKKIREWQWKKSAHKTSSVKKIPWGKKEKAY